MLAKTRGNDYCGPNSNVDTFADQSRDGGRGGRQDGKIDGLGDVAHALVRFRTQNLRALRIDGIDPSVESRVQEILKYRSPYGPGTLGCADYRDGIGAEHRIQTLLLRGMLRHSRIRPLSSIDC